MAEPGAAILGRARSIAEDLLWPAAGEIDRAPTVPVHFLDALAEAGMYGLYGPGSVGGLDADTPTAGRVVAALAGSSCVTAFVWVQHHSAVRLARAAPVALRDAWLARLCSGEVRSGIAVAAMRRPGPPAMTATPAAGGARWHLDGHAPWVTGWGLIDVVLVAARHGDDLVWALVDAVPAPSLQVVPQALAAQQASATVTLHLSDHPAEADRVLAVEPYEHWRARDARGLRQNGYFPVGVAERAARLLDSPIVAEETETLAAALAERPDDDIPAVRAAASLLAVRATTALVVERGGRAVGLDDPAQRLARDAMFLLVFGQTPSIRAEQVRQLGASSAHP
jgi:alkylation response protein AidB-like acyl-CoA dehydrogenase